MGDKADFHTRVTDKIIADLEKGNLTWMQPWQAEHAAGPVSRPLRSNGMPYQGINVLLLWMASLENGYSAPIWMTYKQAQEVGGQIRKGEHGTQVVYANAYTKTETDAKSGEEVEKRIPFLKTYTVFNVEQIDGLPGHFYAPAQPITHENERIAAAEAFFASTGATIKHGGNSAFYRSDLDLVQMPPFAAFRDSDAYYGTLAHEVTHWTKHPTRLGRDFGRKRFGDEGYAMEELVAELGAAFVCADLGIAPEPREETAAYIQSWLKALKHDKHAIFTAASHAQKATDFLHRTVEQAEARISETYERSTEQERARGGEDAAAPSYEHLYQRGEDGYPIGADTIMRDAYGPIPKAVEFQHGNGGNGVPETVHGWQWSSTFGRWSALVTFGDGWHGFTYPLAPRLPDHPALHSGEQAQGGDTAIEQVKEEAATQERSPKEYEQQSFF